MTLRNYTPHPVTITEGADAGVYESEGVARVDPLPLGPVVGLPRERRGQRILVSVLVAERLPMRGDLRVPTGDVCDRRGRVIGSLAVALPRDVSPALALLLASVETPA